MTDRHREQMSNTLIGDDCIMGTGRCSISGTCLGTTFNLENTCSIQNLTSEKMRVTLVEINPSRF